MFACDLLSQCAILKWVLYCNARAVFKYVLCEGGGALRVGKSCGRRVREYGFAVRERRG